jgi:hypothetical protein
MVIDTANAYPEPAAPEPASRHTSLRRTILGLMLLAPFVAGCAGLSNQIVIPHDEDPNNVADAQHEADQICAARGRRARFVMWENHVGGHNASAGAPDAIYDCVPSGPPVVAGLNANTTGQR